MSTCLAKELGVVHDVVAGLNEAIGTTLGSAGLNSAYIPGTYLLAEYLDDFGIEYQLKSGTVVVGGNRGKEKAYFYRVWLEVDKIAYDVGRRAHEAQSGQRVRTIYKSSVTHKMTEEEKLTKDLVETIGREYDIFWCGVHEEVLALKEDITKAVRVAYLQILEDAIPEE